MPASVKIVRRRELRRLYRSKVRQALFLNDYIQHKYVDIHAEADQFYNGLNELYPTKHDLRKTLEYRSWKMQVLAQAKKKTRKRLNPTHPSIQTPIQIHPQSGITVVYEDQPTNPDPSEQSETPYEDQPSNPDPSEQSETPYEDQPSSPDSSEQSETPYEDQPSSPDPSEQSETPGESLPLRPVELRSGEHTYTDNMQLRIPLLNPPANHPAVTDRTLQSVTEEILEEGLQPSLYEELSPEVIEKIISELQAEPDLQSILTNIEQQLEFEQLGMDIDIPGHDLLENELENW